MAKTQVTKIPGKCATLHALWAQAGDGELLPRAFAIELAVAEGHQLFDRPDAVSGTREGNQARDPGARERAAVVIPAGIAGLTWLFGIAMKAQP